MIATAPGDYQSELGCSGDWDPSHRGQAQDPDGDGIGARGHAAAGSYEAKAAINEGWDENYGAGGVLNGPNIPFTVTDEPVKFSYNAATHILDPDARARRTTSSGTACGTTRATCSHRTPGGAVAKGTAVALRLRTFHDDVTRVRARVYDLNTNALQLLEMERAASDVSLPGRPRRPHLRLLASHGQQGRSGQPLVPVRRHRRHRHGLLRRRHGRARRCLAA